MNRQKILEFVSFLGTLVSVISLFLEKREWGWQKNVLLCSLIIVFGISVYILFIKSDTQTYKTQKEINIFMKQWIKTDGVVKIFSRDLSWVDDEMIGILQSKGSDLYIYVEKKNETVNRIHMINPQMHCFYYEEMGFVPSSRFTVIRANKDDKQIAIAIKEHKGYKEKFKHEIYISRDSLIDKKILGLANDLMNCIECRNKYDKKDSSSK